MFNQSISSGIVPVEWNLLDLSEFLKRAQERMLTDNYRPISIISAVAKIFERIIYDQFCKYLNDNDLLANCQSETNPA